MAALQVLKPSDIVNDVLLWLHKAGTAAPARVEAYVSSFGLSARRYSIILPPAHGALLLQCISSQVHHHLPLTAPLPCGNPFLRSCLGSPGSARPPQCWGVRDVSWLGCRARRCRRGWC